MSDALTQIQTDSQINANLTEILVAVFNNKWDEAKKAWDNRPLSMGYHNAPLSEWIGEGIELKDRNKLLKPLEEHELVRIEYLAGKDSP